MGVRVRGERLVIDFRFYLPDGRRVRAVESEGPNNKRNTERVQAKWKAIKYEMVHGRFDYLRHFPHGSKVKLLKPTTGKTLAEWWDEWLAEKTLKHGTRIDYRYKYEKHIAPHFGHYDLGDITDTEVAVFRKKLFEVDGLQASTVNQIIKILCMALKRATAKGFAPTYACEDIGKLSEKPVDIDPFSFDELRAWLAVLQKRDAAFHDLILFWSRTGLRPGELYAMKWVNLDRFNRKYCVRESKSPSGRIDVPKTPHSVRDVSLSDAALEALSRQEARSGLHDFVWLHNGRLWYPDLMRGKFQHYLRLAGMKYRPPKQMRHTFATLHIGAGENISWVSRTLGHSSVEITLKRYNRFIPNLTRQDGSAFERVMEGDFGNNPATTADKSLKSRDRFNTHGINEDNTSG